MSSFFFYFKILKMEENEKDKKFKKSLTVNDLKKTTTFTADSVKLPLKASNFR